MSTRQTDKTDSDEIDVSDVRRLPLIEQRVVSSEPYSAENFERYRKVLVSPTVNTPEEGDGIKLLPIGE